MNNILIFSPWFGDLPEYKDWFKGSVELSTNIDWYVVSDQDPFFEAPHLTWVKQTREEFSKEFQEKVGVKATFENPLQLCDARIYFGRMYKDLVSKYDFWGFSDWDIEAGMDKLDVSNVDKLRPHLFCEEQSSTPFLFLPSSVDWGSLVDTHHMHETSHKAIDEVLFLRNLRKKYDPVYHQKNMLDPGNPYVTNMRLVKYALRRAR